MCDAGVLCLHTQNYALLEMVGSASSRAGDPMAEYALDSEDLHLESVISYEGCWGEVKRLDTDQICNGTQMNPCIP